MATIVTIASMKAIVSIVTIKDYNYEISNNVL